MKPFLQKKTNHLIALEKVQSTFLRCKGWPRHHQATASSGQLCRDFPAGVQGAGGLISPALHPARREARPPSPASPLPPPA